MRRYLIAGNWKMNLLSQQASAFVERLTSLMAGREIAPEVVLFPSFLSISAALSVPGRDQRIHVGAQTCAAASEGAFTGDVSASMVRDAGCEWVLVGHSERRQYHHEKEADFSRMIEQAHSAGLHVVYCVGETLDERKAGRQIDVVRGQLEPIYHGLDGEASRLLTIAYEPVWAIGTGETATPAQAQDMHAHIRTMIADQAGSQVAETTRILYGGSMKPGNAGELLEGPDVDGGLIGGASLDPQSFFDMVAIAHERSNP